MDYTTLDNRLVVSLITIYDHFAATLKDLVFVGLLQIACDIEEGKPTLDAFVKYWTDISKRSLWL